MVAESDEVMLCSHCTSLDAEALYGGQQFTHMRNPQRDLRESALRCPLCALIRAALNQDTARKLANADVEDKYYEQHLKPEPIIIRRPTSDLTEMEHMDDCWTNRDLQQVTLMPQDDSGPLREIEVSIQTDMGEDIVRLTVFANPDSAPARKGIVQGLLPISDSSSPEALIKIKRWIHDCLSSHEECGGIGFDVINQTSTHQFMPDRLLDLRSAEDSQDCRVVHTTGIRDHYAALSHCWGSFEFLTTRKGNLQDHLISIAVKSLPKTFQDAITICGGLDIRFLWIDSLCIVQDDPQDWEEQSIQMGSIYQHALVALAATHSKDGRDGLFLPRPNLSTPAHVQFHKGQDIRADYVTVAMHPDQKQYGIDGSALDNRAWITQEWLSSRRMVHFTQAQLVWSCGVLTESETGGMVFSAEREHLRLTLSSSNKSEVTMSDEDFYADWCEIVTSYCSRMLTYETDKPVAIAGLMVSQSEFRNQPYTHGVWHDTAGLVPSSQLLWFGTREPMRRPEVLAQIPSWSWMSTMGRLAFHQPGRKAKPDYCDIRVRESTLHLRAHVMVMPTAWGPVLPDTVFKESPFDSWFTPASFESGTFILPQGLYLLGESAQRSGWASFDLGIVPSGEVLCCAISEVVSEDGTTEGWNVLYLESRGSTYARIGMGEILFFQHLFQTPKVNVSIV